MSYLDIQYEIKNPYRRYIIDEQNNLINNYFYSEQNNINSNDYGPIQHYYNNYRNYRNYINDSKPKKQNELPKNSNANYNIIKYPENISRQNQKHNYINLNNSPIVNIAQTNVNDFKMNLYKEKKENERIEETNKSIPNPNSDLNIQLLKVLIYIYAYDKGLSKENIFNNNEKYYLIKQEWFTNFKKFYSYDIFTKKLESLNLDINYNNIDFQINNIMYNYLMHFQIEYKPFKNLLNISTKYKAFKDIKITMPGFIIPSKIMNIIKNLNQHLKDIEPKNFTFKNNFLYYIKINDKEIENKEIAIIIGKFLNNAKFKPIYILNYDSHEILQEEFKKITENNINKYIKQYKCNLDKDVQELKNEYDQKIGYFIIYSKYNPSKQVGNIQRSKTNPKKFKAEQFNAQKIDEVENKIVKNKNILINNNNILNKQIINLKEEVHNKSDQFQDNNDQILKLKNENNADIIKKKNIQIQNLNTEVNKLRKQYNNIYLQLTEKDKKIQETNILQKKNFTILNEEYKKLKEQNDDYKNQILQIEIERDKSKEKIDGMESQLLNQKGLINKINKLNRRINELEQELNQRNEKITTNNSIKDELNKIKNEKNTLINLINDKDLELIKMQTKLKMQINNNEAIRLKEKEIEKMKKEFEEKEISFKNISEKNKELEKQHEELNNNNNDLKKQIKNLEDEIKSYKEKISNQNDIINNNNILIRRINDSNEELKQKIKQITTNNSIKEELNKLRNENNLLTKSNNDSDSELKVLKLELKKQNNNDKEKSLAIKSKEQEIEKMKKEFEVKEISFKNISEKNKELEKQHEVLNNNNNDLKKKLTYLEDEIKSYKEKISNQNDIINHNDNFNKQLNSLKEQLNQKDNEIANIKSNNKMEIDRLKIANNSLESEKKEVEKKLSLLNNEYNQRLNKEANIKSLQSKESEIEKNIKDLVEKEKNLKGLNERITNTNKKIEELENDKLLLEAKNKKLIEEIKRNETQLTNQKDLINLNKQLDDKNQELKQKKKEIENIKLLKNQEIEKLKNEKETLFKKNNDKEIELKRVKSVFEIVKKNEIKFMTLKNKEQEIDKKLKELDEKEKKALILKEKNKNLEKKNLELETNKINLTKQNDKLLKDIKQLEAQIVSKKDILEKINENQKKMNQIQNNKNNININNQNQQNIIQQQNYGNFNQNNFNQFNPMNNNNINLNPNSQPLMNNFIQNQNMNNQINISPPINTNTSQNSAAINDNKPEPPKPPKPPKQPEPLSFYDIPPLIGLNNIGSTCYKNSVLQCLSQTKDLTNYFLKENNKEKIMNNNYSTKFPRDLQLCPMFYDLIQKLWEKGKYRKSFSPNEFMDSIAKMTKNDQVQFSLNEAGDAKDFIIYLLERMHNELKKPIKNKELIVKANPDEPLNQYDKQNALIHFMDEFQNDTSIISDLFYGFNETTNVCQFCKNSYNSKGQQEPICYNYGIFNILIFPLDEVRKYRDQFYRLNNMTVNMGNMVNLTECFYYNQKSDYFTGDNKNYCNICKQLYDSVYTSRIFVSPNIIIMILNRGKGNIFDIKIDFAMQLDITDFVMFKDKRQIYNLYGVITHLGKSGPSAHFIASCKSPIDGKWYRYNDAFVDPITDFQKEVYNFGVPYILFYEKQK